MNLTASPAALSPSPPAGGPLTPVVAWLAQRPAGLQPQDIGVIKTYLALLNQSLLPTAQFLGLLDGLWERTRLLSAGLETQLARAVLPLAPAQREIADGLVRVHGVLGLSYERALALLGQSDLANPALRGRILARAMASAVRQITVAELVCIAPPLGAWQLAHRLYQTIAENPPPHSAPDTPDALDDYRVLLAHSTLFQAGFTPEEMAWAEGFLHAQVGAIELSKAFSVAWRIGAYWVDLQKDHGPQAVLRKPAENRKTLLYLSCSRLLQSLRSFSARLDAGATAADLGLPAYGSSRDLSALLLQLRRRWASSTKRLHHRRDKAYRVEIGVGIDAVWRILEGGSPPRRPAAGLYRVESPQAAAWQVINESPGGFCVRQVSGIATRLRPGEVVALRSGPASEWSICLVRWMRSQRVTGMELGLELIAQRARPARLLSPERRSLEEADPALLLSPLKALREKPAILAARGSHHPRGKFVLVLGGERIVVQEVRALNLDEQTARVEVFQFERDASPEITT